MDNAKALGSYLAQVADSLAQIPVAEIVRVLEVLERARHQRKSIFTLGNGGSAAMASHLACDLAKGAICPGKPRIKAYALTDNVPLICAWANDESYESIFSEQLENLVEPGDVVIAVSGSGNSPNVLEAVKTAKAKGATTIGLTGDMEGKLKEMVDVALVVPNSNMLQIEDIHLVLCHAITTCLRGNR